MKRSVMSIMWLVSALLFTTQAYSQPKSEPQDQSMVKQGWIKVKGFFIESPKKKREKGWYLREDHQYFRTIVADIRRSYTHMRFYLNEAVPLTHPKNKNENSNANHRFWDVAFGDLYSLFGYHSSFPGTNKTRGIDVFVEPAVHMLLDFDASSSAVINADYRLGGGLRGRSIPVIWKGSWFSWKARYFHESTHLGDEYVMDAQKHFAEDYRRYNVSYEAKELYIAIDRMIKTDSYLIPQLYGRIYAGARQLKRGKYKEESRGDKPQLSGRNELQMGFEFFYRQFPSTFKVKWVTISYDLYKRYEYNTVGKKKADGKNLVIGIIMGDLFQNYDEHQGFIIGRRSVGFQINYYKGPNPHGQFRSKSISYIGFDYIVSI